RSTTRTKDNLDPVAVKSPRWLSAESGKLQIRPWENRQSANARECASDLRAKESGADHRRWPRANCIDQIQRPTAGGCAARRPYHKATDRNHPDRPRGKAACADLTTPDNSRAQSAM